VELLKRGRTVRATLRDPARESAFRGLVERQVDPAGRLEVAFADLTADESWAEAVSGCDAVMHIASPMGAADPQGLLDAAVNGTRRVLGAACEEGVRRVVMTSSTAACTPAAPLDRAIDESDWTDPDQPDLSTYRKSKALSERAAWDLVQGRDTGLTTILPGAIFGPVMNREQLGSVGIIDRLLKGQPPALPRLAFNITDVRDLVDLHIRALDTDAAAGRRFIAMGPALWYRDVAEVLRRRLGDDAANVPGADLPDEAFRALAETSAEMKGLLPLLGRTQAFSSDAARQVLGFAPRPAEDTVADCGASLVG